MRENPREQSIDLSCDQVEYIMTLPQSTIWIILSSRSQLGVVLILPKMLSSVLSGSVLIPLSDDINGALASTLQRPENCAVAWLKDELDQHGDCEDAEHYEGGAEEQVRLAMVSRMQGRAASESFHLPAIIDRKGYVITM